jgi:hypothetical protein
MRSEAREKQRGGNSRRFEQDLEPRPEALDELVEPADERLHQVIASSGNLHIENDEPERLLLASPLHEFGQRRDLRGQAFAE